VAVVALLGALGPLGCGDDESGDATAVAVDPGVGLEAVVSCLSEDGWTETGSLSSGSAYTVDAESGTSVLLSVTEPGEDPLLDETTYTVAAADPADASLKVENIIGTISDDERGQIEACAAG
jgi:hypothetical protein